MRTKKKLTGTIMGAVTVAAVVTVILTGCSTEVLNGLAEAVATAAEAPLNDAAVSIPVHVDKYDYIPDSEVKDDLDRAINRAIKAVNENCEEALVTVLDYEPEPLCYESLGEYSKYVYDVMYEASSTFTPCTISESDLGSNPFGAYVAALDALRADHPELLLCFDMDALSREYKSVFFVANKGLNYPTDDIDAAREGYDRYLETFDRIIAAIPDGMTNYERCIYLTAVICALTTYNHDTSAMYDPFQAYNALVAGKSICQGYSQAFMLLAHAAGVNCTQMESKSGNHVWNVVETLEGTRYIDVTWVDGDCEDYSMDFSRTYFFMDDEDLSVYGYTDL